LGGIRFPYLYFSLRCGSILITAGGLLAWAMTGFNIVEGAVPLIGLQWSTFATFSFFFYLMVLNFQRGGDMSFKILAKNIEFDLRFIGSMLKREKSRGVYPRGFAINPFKALIMASLVCISALFAFESIWVPLYDYFQFGSVMWPVYFAITSFPPVILRNIGLFLAPLFLAILLAPLRIEMGKVLESSVKWRLDLGFVWLLVLAASFWLAWIAIPHQAVPVNGIIGPTASTFSLSNCYIFPSQHFFPQNTYTFYPCALQGSSYTPPQILGFFNPDPFVHLINVLTKVATFAAVCYPMMARKSA